MASNKTSFFFFFTPQPQNSVSDLDDDDDTIGVSFIERDMNSGEAVVQFIQDYADKQHKQSERHRSEEVAENENGTEVASDEFESINSTNQIQSNNQEVGLSPEFQPKYSIKSFAVFLNICFFSHICLWVHRIPPC